MRISVNFKSLDFQRGLKAAYKNQFPFATARALTKTAKDVQEDLKRNLHHSFTLRNNHLERGIKIEPAKKTKLKATVGSIDPILVGHVTGEIRSGTGERSIPTKKIRPNFASRVPRGKKPSRLLKKSGKQKPFFLKLPSGQNALAQRNDDRTLKVLYSFPKKVKVEKRFHFDDLVSASVARHWQSHMLKSLDHALASKR